MFSFVDVTKLGVMAIKCKQTNKKPKVKNSQNVSANKRNFQSDQSINDLGPTQKLPKSPGCPHSSMCSKKKKKKGGSRGE